MAGCLLLSRGLTRAQIMQKTMGNHGIRSSIVRPPREIAVDGCGYAVRVEEENLSRAKTVLRNNHINTTRIYRETPWGYDVIQ